ncbi:MAG: hypothetical protein ACXAAO_07415 [Candidatus Thorarchaeota archaeon]|jgi:hypothetical protein
MVRNDGEPLYGRSIEDDACIDANMLPSLVRNSVVMMQSSSSTSTDRVYILEIDDSVWAYSFYHTFSLVSLASKDQSISQLKNIMSSLGHAISLEYGEIIDTWSGSMSDIVDVNTLIDKYVSLDLNRPTTKILNAITRLVNKAMKKPEIAIVGVFDSEGEMLRGNVPDVYLFRIQVEISQGVIKPVMDIAPSTINSGDHVLQMLKVHSLTVVVASQPSESNLHAISTIGDIAHTLNDKLS